jgi:beta-glucanase (GH16 family)
MKKHALMLLVGLSCVAGASLANDFPRLVWQDEFDGTAIDTNKWEFEVNARGGGNNELQYYVTNNAWVSNGSLYIEARQERYTGPEGTREFTSSRLRTLHRGDWLHGRFEIRAKLPIGQGYWPAIWMLPTDKVYGGWPKSGEIDIMEIIGHKPNVLHGTLHYEGPKGWHTFQGTNTTLRTGTFADDFHVFGLEWRTNELRWFLDQQLYQVQTNWPTKVGAFPAPFDQKFHLILNVAVGGNWPGAPDAKTVFPQAMVVDYVRVYGK